MESRSAKCCCVPGCKELYNRKHRFPIGDETVFETWINQVNNPKLSGLTPKQIYNSYRVCEKHFLQADIINCTKRGLKRTAVPMLYLVQDEENKENLPVSSKKRRSDHTYFKHPDMEQSLLDIPGPSKGKTQIEHNFQDISNMIEDEANILIREEGINYTDNEEVMEKTLLEMPISAKKGLIDHDYCLSEKSVIRNRGINYIALRKRHLLLKEVNVTRQCQLDPAAQHFYKKVIQWGKRNYLQQKKITSLKHRLKNATMLQNSLNFERLLKYVNHPTYNFITSQIRNQSRHPKGRRYTIEEQILSLTLMKNSYKGYKFLSKVFSLPSRGTLTKLLCKIPIVPGVSYPILENLKNVVPKMKKYEKYCILLFDEMSLDIALQYNRKRKIIEGFEDDGTVKTTTLADHVNVFLLKGVYSKWKQPIAFSFCSGSTKGINLKKMIMEIIRHCSDIGLNVIGTICDQGSSNQSAIKLLMNETQEEFNRLQMDNRFFGFTVDGKEVVPLFDPPHLFKGIRNNLITKELHYTLNGKNMTAKWSHIIEFYHLDTLDDTRLCPKLNDSNVIPEKINKMKVSSCTKVFSYQVGSLMKRLSMWGVQDGLKKEAIETAELILFLDTLFDSINGSTKKAPESKPLKGGVNINSGHIKFWRDSIKTLETFKFYCPNRKKFVNSPSIKNLIFTIKGFIYITQMLLKEVNYLIPRAFNQDALENFFGNIRSHGARYNNPDCTHFISSFKTLLINNFLSSHSPSSNCEKDETTRLLDNLKSFLQNTNIDSTEVLDDEIKCNIPNNVNQQKKTKVALCTINYFAGYLIKKLKIKDCEICKHNLLGNPSNLNMDIISARTYRNSHLIFPGQVICQLTNVGLSYLFYLLPRISHLHVEPCLFNFLRNKLTFSELHCDKHDIKQLFCKKITLCTIFFWCKRINLILHGKDSKFIKMYNQKDISTLDPIKVQAHRKFLKKLKKK